MAEHTCAVDGRKNCYRCAEIAEESSDSTTKSQPKKQETQG